MTDLRWIDTRDVAKIARRLLKAAFPATKFSVRIQRYAGGSSVHVGWTDGPTQGRVDEVVGWLVAGSFDGMTDSYNYTKGGTLFEGERVRFSNSYMNVDRHLSDECKLMVGAAILEEIGDDRLPLGEAARLLSETAGWHCQYPGGSSRDLGSMVWMVANDRTRLGMV